MCHFPYMANATPEEEIYNPSHSLKFRAIPTDFLLNLKNTPHNIRVFANKIHYILFLYPK